MHGRKNKQNCALKLVNEIILYYDARSKKHQNNILIKFSIEASLKIFLEFNYAPR